MSLLPAAGVVVSALWAVWTLACGLVAWGCLRAARDYRDDAPLPGPVWDADRQQWARHHPYAPDDRPGTRDDLLVTCNRLWDLDTHQPKGDR